MRVFILIFLTISFVTLSCGGKRAGENSKEKQLGDQKTLALASLLRKNFQQALVDIQEAEDMDDDDPEVYNIKGLIYFALKEYGEAEKSYKEAIEIKSDYSEARYNLCGLYLTLDQWDKAIDECSKAVSDVLYRSRDKAFTSLGVAYFRKGDIDKAKECYQKSLEVNPALVYAHNELGKLYMSTGNEEEGIEEFRKAINGYNMYDEAYYNLGLAYLKIGKTEDACASFKKVIGISPDSVLGTNAKSYLTSLCKEKETL
ncbi:MAG TPA: tetratricopeptide repeat protein [Thermodesulfobacteriota bacterium]|nr:tetratricopeptide repeat protein [Thermodesulfobacteriota bacterium]